MASTEDETLHTIIATAILNRLNAKNQADPRYGAIPKKTKPPNQGVEESKGAYPNYLNGPQTDEDKTKSLKQLLYTLVFNKLVETHAPLQGTGEDLVSIIPVTSHTSNRIRIQHKLITVEKRLRDLISAVPSPADAAAASTVASAAGSASTAASTAAADAAAASASAAASTAAAGAASAAASTVASAAGSASAAASTAAAGAASTAIGYMHMAYETLSRVSQYFSPTPSHSPTQSPTQPSLDIRDAISMIQNAIKSTDPNKNEEIIQGLEWCLKELETVLQYQKDQEIFMNELTSKLIKNIQIIVYEIKATIVNPEHMDSCEMGGGNEDILQLYERIKDANVSREEKEKILLCATIELHEKSNIPQKYSFWKKLDNVYDSLDNIQYLDDPSITYIYMIFKDWEIFKHNHRLKYGDEMRKLFKLFFIHNSFFRL